LEKGHGAHPFEEIDFPKRAREMLLMGLRLAEGISLSRFEAESGLPLLEFVNPRQVTMLEGEGLLERSGDRIAATASGRQKLNAVLAYLLSA
jgi:oxygen-independent coproporphyrinogen-3 oxidase